MERQGNEFYGLTFAPVSGAVWCSSRCAPGAPIREGHQDNAEGLCREG